MTEDLSAYKPITELDAQTQKALAGVPAGPICIVDNHSTDEAHKKRCYIIRYTGNPPMAMYITVDCKSYHDGEIDEKDMWG